MAPLSERHSSATGGIPFGTLALERGSSCGSVAGRRIATAGLLLGLSAAGGGPLSPSEPSHSALNSGIRRAVSFRAPPTRRGAAAAPNGAGPVSLPLHATSTGSAGDALVQVHVAGPAGAGAGAPPCDRVCAMLHQNSMRRVQQQAVEPAKAAGEAAAAVVQPSYGMYGELQPLDAMDAGAVMLPRRLSRSAFDVRGGGGNMSPAPVAAGLGATSGRSLLRRHDSNSARRRSCQSGLPPQLIAISDYLSNANHMCNAGHSIGGGAAGAGVGTDGGGGGVGAVGAGNGGAAGGGRRVRRLSNLGSNVHFSLTATAPNLSLAPFAFGGAGGSRPGSRGVQRKSVPNSSDSFLSITSRSRPPSSPAPGCARTGSASSSQVQVAVTAAPAGDAIRQIGRRRRSTAEDAASGGPVIFRLPWMPAPATGSGGAGAGAPDRTAPPSRRGSKRGKRATRGKETRDGAAAAAAGGAQPCRRSKASTARRSGQASRPREGTDGAAAAVAAATTTTTAATKTAGKAASAGGRHEGPREGEGSGGGGGAAQGWAAAAGRRMQLRWAAVKSSLQRLASPLTACSRPYGAGDEEARTD